MSDYQIRHFAPSDIQQVTVLQKAYADIYPGALVIPGEVYLSPGFDSGRTVFCAFDAGRLVGYAPLYPNIVRASGPQRHKFWAEIKTDPDLPEPLPLKDILFDQILGCAREIAAAYPSHPAQLLFQYLVSETASIDYVLSHGCTRTGGIYRMVRDLARPIPETRLPEMLVSRSWRMESADEQTMYVAAHNACFPDSPLALADWQYFLSSPAWATGTTFTAFRGSEIVGSVLVYFDEGASSARSLDVGATERIYVNPAWQRRGVASHLICQALAYLRDQGLAEAILEVYAANRSALRLYEGLGYRVVQESNLYGLDVPD